MEKPLISREYGAWSMLLVPFFVGVGVSLKFDLKILLLFLAIVFGFLARYSLLITLKGKKSYFSLALYTTLSIFSLAFLIFWYKLWYLTFFIFIFLVFLAAYLYMTLQKLDRTVFGELFTILGLNFTSCVSYYTATGRIDKTLVLLWVLNFFYFGGSVFYVKLKLETKKNEKSKMKTPNIVYHLSVFVILLFLMFLNQIPKFSFISFVPAFFKRIKGSFEEKPLESLKSLGISELFHSILFGTLLTLSFHL